MRKRVVLPMMAILLMFGVTPLAMATPEDACVTSSEQTLEEMVEESKGDEETLRIERQIKDALMASVIRFISEDGHIYFKLDLNHKAYSEIMFDIQPLADGATIKSLVFFKASPSAYREMLNFIALLNMEMRYTTYVMNMQDGTILLRCYVSKEELNQNATLVLKELFFCCFSTFRQHLDAFKSVNDGVVTPYEAWLGLCEKGTTPIAFEKYSEVDPFNPTESCVKETKGNE